MNPEDVLKLLPKMSNLKQYLAHLLFIVVCSSLLAAIAIGFGWFFGDWNFSLLYASFPIITGIIFGVVGIISSLVGFIQHRRGKIVGRDRMRMANALRAGLGQADAANLPAIAIQPERLSDADDAQQRIRLRWLANVAMAPMAVSRGQMLLMIASLSQISIQYSLQFVLRDYLNGSGTTFQQAKTHSEILSNLALLQMELFF